jgi:hypothetical protein
MLGPVLVLLLQTTAAGPLHRRRRSRVLASSGNKKEAWTGRGIFLPADLTERDVFVDGLDGREAEHAAAEENRGPHTAADAGEVGRLFFGLLRRSRAQERASPNVGGSANAFTRVEGARTAQRRNATVVLSSGPLNAAALGTAGAAAVAPGGAGDLARADARAGSSAYANAILDDENKHPKDFWASGSSRGSTVAVGTGSGPARAAGAQTVLGTAAAAGEQAAQGRAGLGIGPFLVLFNLGSRDGAQQSGGAGSVGIGERASTRLQVASLAEGDKSDESVDLDKRPRPPPPPPPTKGKEEKQDEKNEKYQEGQQQLRTSSSSPSPPSLNKPPPTAYDRATARKRDKQAARKKRREEKDEAKPKSEDPGIVTGGRVECKEKKEGQEEGEEDEGGARCQDDANDQEYRGASALRAWADSADIPSLSTTSSGIADFNVRAGLSSEAAANRYGYSRGISTGSAAATGTRGARARVTSASAGTGYVVKGTSATSRVVQRAEAREEGRAKDEHGKGEGKERDDEGGREVSGGGERVFP